MNNQFSYIIINLNNKKIRLFPNSKINKFLREIIISNMLILLKSKKVMIQVTFII